VTDLPLNVVSMCTAMLNGKNRKPVTYTDGCQVWQAKRIKNGFQFVLLSDADDEGGIENVPLPFPSP
jgi:hypothetical protein